MLNVCAETVRTLAAGYCEVGAGVRLPGGHPIRQHCISVNLEVVSLLSNTGGKYHSAPAPSPPSSTSLHDRQLISELNAKRQARPSMAENLWKIALSRLKQTDSDATAVLELSDGSVQRGVVGLIDDIERQKSAREEEGGWTITLPGQHRDGTRRVISVRRTVYSILEAAFEFKDIVDKVLTLDPTGYGKSPLSTSYPQTGRPNIFRGYCMGCCFLWGQS